MKSATSTSSSSPTPTIDQLDIYSDHYYDLQSLALAAHALLDLNEERNTCPYIESATRLLNIIEEKIFKICRWVRRCLE